MNIEDFQNDPIYQRYQSKMAALRPDQVASINAVIDNTPYAQDAMQRAFFGEKVKADWENTQKSLDTYNKSLIYSSKQNREALGLAKLGTLLSAGSALAQFGITAKSTKQINDLAKMYQATYGDKAPNLGFSALSSLADSDMASSTEEEE